MSNLVQDVRYAARQMARRPGLTIFAVLSLALGIGVNSSISPWSTPCCCATCRRYGRRNWWTSTTARAGEFRLRSRIVPRLRRPAGLVRRGFRSRGLQPDHRLVGHRHRTELLFGEEVTASYFDLLGLRPAFGRSFLPQEDATPGSRQLTILGYRLWSPCGWHA